MRKNVTALIVFGALCAGFIYAEPKEVNISVVQIFVNGERQILDRKADTKATLFIALFGNIAELSLQGYTGADSGIFTYSLISNNNKIKKIASLNTVVDDRYLKSTFTTSVDYEALPATIAAIPETVLATNISVDLLPAKYSEFEKFQTDIHSQLILSAFEKEIARKLKAPYPETISGKLYFTAIPEQNIDETSYIYKLRVKLELDTTNTAAIR